MTPCQRGTLIPISEQEPPQTKQGLSLIVIYKEKECTAIAIAGFDGTHFRSVFIFDENSEFIGYSIGSLSLKYKFPFQTTHWQYLPALADPQSDLEA